MGGTQTGEHIGMARIVGQLLYRKAIWLMLFPFFRLTAPPRLKAIKMCGRWSQSICMRGSAMIVALVYSALAWVLSGVRVLFPSGCTGGQLDYRRLQLRDQDEDGLSCSHYYGPINLVARTHGLSQ